MRHLDSGHNVCGEVFEAWGRLRCIACGHTWPLDSEGFVVGVGRKYANDLEWEQDCDECGQPVTVTNARLEVIGAYHSGCFGYPMCSCATRHMGECAT